MPPRRHPYSDTGRGLYLVERLASITAQVGGDWYDGFALPDGGTAVVIGDVTGSDIDATATMSRLSSMLRGISVVCRQPPEEALRHLDMANRTRVQEATGTCVYAGAHGSRAAGSCPDGLIERRGEPLDRGLDRLREHAAALSRAPLEVFCDELLTRLGSDSDDDIALRPTPP
ncbi:PP2C family protein-serine/threonine phosphatase [Actinomadura nitritigenes]|uniref:PP2C family protein-serine/threonine phosphatase n=1 Tax=Actinomadura nitritigenes TaxID=134602 RepID=UPI0036B043F8